MEEHFAAAEVGISLAGVTFFEREQNETQDWRKNAISGFVGSGESFAKLAASNFVFFVGLGVGHLLLAARVAAGLGLPFRTPAVDLKQKQESSTIKRTNLSGITLKVIVLV